MREKQGSSLKGSPMRHRPSPQLARRELLRIDGEPVSVTIRHNPRARRLIIKVHPTTGEVSVVAPSKRALDHALDFARSETDWIKRRLAKVPRIVELALGATVLFKGDEHFVTSAPKGLAPVWVEEEKGERFIRVAGRAEHAPRRLLDFFKREARQSLAARTVELAGRIGMRPARISVRDTQSRWGSCSTERSLSYSWRLILAPPFVLDYVVAHEVAHMRHMNHGPRFWKLVRELSDQSDAAQDWLGRNGPLLHRYAVRASR
jgi:predicted metal-dependent hydrolase